MAVIRRNNVAMISTTGGTGAIVVSTPIDGRATFQQAVGATSGTFQLEYFIEGPGMHEEGLGTFDAATGILTRTSILESWTEAGGFGTAPLSLPTTEVTVRLAPTANRVPSVDAIGTVAAANLSGDANTFLNGAGAFTAPPTAGAPAWDDITGKPSTFPPTTTEDSIPQSAIASLTEDLAAKADVNHTHPASELEADGEAPEGAYLDKNLQWTVPPGGVSEFVKLDDVEDGVISEGLIPVGNSDGKLELQALTAAHISDAEPTALNDGEYVKRDGGDIVGADLDQLQADARTDEKVLPFAISGEGTLFVLPKAPHKYTLTKLSHGKIGAGSLTLKVQIAGVDVTGLTGITPDAVTEPFAETAASGANTVNAGDSVSIVASSLDGTVTVAGSLHFTPVNS